MKQSGSCSIWLCASALLLTACTQWPTSREHREEAHVTHCTDRDRDGYGPGCSRGFDCNDSDPQVTTECSSTCALRPQEGCPCTEGAVERCFLPDQLLPNNQVLCSEGTRVCRSGVWSGCEQPHEYIAQVRPDQQALVDMTRADQPCSVCDILCFKITDPLTVSDGGTAGGSVQFGKGGGLELLPEVTDAGPDAGVATSCDELSLCCYRLASPLRAACEADSKAGVTATCSADLKAYCEPAVITGPRPDCTLVNSADNDCDGIPNAVDAKSGPPFATTHNQTIFHELAPGTQGSNALAISYKLNSADVYLLFDTTGTMGPARDNLSKSLTSGNVVHCAQLAQCCAGDETCEKLALEGKAADCYAAQPTYCKQHINCADTDLDGKPNNELVDEGVLGGIRCLIGDARFGLGRFRELPIHQEPEPLPCDYEGGCRYGDRDEQLFRHLVDMTSDRALIDTALGTLDMNYNWDEPEGGYLALHSVVTGGGHYFGIHRPAVPERRKGDGCAAETFGYPCFRRAAVPLVLMFTDAPHHNGPGNSTIDPSDCYGRGPGCPYAELGPSDTYTSDSEDSASDGVAHFVSRQAERGATAYDAGDVRGKYLTLVGDTGRMAAHFKGGLVGCGADDAAPDAVIRFEIGAGDAINVNFHLTKNDAYDPAYYGEWDPWSHPDGSDDPTPGTEFGAVISVFRDSPDLDSSTPLDCASDPQPSPLQGTKWPNGKLDFSLELSTGTYYVVVKGTTASSAGLFQLQIGETSARGKTVYTPPTWTETRDALAKSGVRVIPVLATGGFSSNFVETAEAQAAALAQASGAVRRDGTPIWYRVTSDGEQTGQAVVNSIADMSRNLAMDVSVVAVDGPDSASRFPITVTPMNSAGCLVPHPLVDASGACRDASATFDCNKQYQCRPGAVPKFQVTFRNPLGSPVPPNPMDPYGGYLFKLQLKANDKYLLTEIPVYIIPNTLTYPEPPKRYAATGVYEQEAPARSCVSRSSSSGDDAGVSGVANSLPSWRDLYFDALLPLGTSIDFQLCTGSDPSDLTTCNWSSRERITVTAGKTCTTNADCADPGGMGYGLCSKSEVCLFTTPPKVWPDKYCTSDSQCPNGPLGSGDYMIETRCETTTGAPNFGRCIGLSVPLNIGATLKTTENGRAYSKLRITLHSNADLNRTPQLFGWQMTYACYSAF